MSVANHVAGVARQEDVEALHRRCGVYTRSDVVRRILDAVGWSSSADLSQARLLEPAAGDGAFVVEASTRLVAAHLERGMPVRAEKLADKIVAFELHPGEAEKARARVVGSLLALGVHHRTATACARAWVHTGDFLLTDLAGEEFTHAVGNPPYVRWSKIPKALRLAYEDRLSWEMLGGDLFLPFLDRALEVLRSGGSCGFICSDRWLHMAFAERFRRKWSSRLTIVSNDPVHASQAFVKDVDSYPTILVASKALRKPSLRPVGQAPAITLAEAGYRVRVGPALGHTPAFVLDPDEHDVERKLLTPWIDASEIQEGKIQWQGRRVVALHDHKGQLIALDRYPRLRARLLKFRKPLTARSIVAEGSPWFRTIDRVIPQHWARPKLLVPELAKGPKVGDR